MKEFGFESIRFVGALLVAHWWPLVPVIVRLMWLAPLRRLILSIENRARDLPFYETYWAVAKRSDPSMARVR